MNRIPSALRRPRLLLAGAACLALAGCVAAALAQDDQDHLFLKDGTTIAGEIEKVTDGVYRVRQANGIVVEVPLGLVERLELGASIQRGPEPEPAATSVAPSVAPAATPASEVYLAGERGSSRRSQSGFDVGLLSMGGRYRTPVDKGGVAHVDIRGVVAVGGLSGSTYALFFAGPQVGFVEDSPVHVLASAAVGTDFYLSYLFLAGGAGVQWDPKGATHVDLNMMIGITTSGSPVVIPELTAGWLW